MDQQQDYKELIAQYLDGSMPQAQRSSFEDLLDSDPLLQSEYSFQQEIIEGIRSHRHGELKRRLAAISPLGFGLIGSLTTAGLLKAAAGVVVVAVLGVAVQSQLPFGEQAATEETEAYEGVDEPVEELAPVAVKPLEAPTSAEAPLADADAAQPTEQSQETTEPAVTSAEATVPSEQTTLAVATAPEKVDSDAAVDQLAATEKEIAVPDLREMAPPAAPQTDLPGESWPYADEAAPEDSGNEPVAISTQLHDRYDFHYRFEDDRIYLYGSFGEEPYELIELHSQDQRRFFLLSQGTYYHLLPTRRVQKLAPVTQEGLLQELQMLQER